MLRGAQNDKRENYEFHKLWQFGVTYKQYNFSLVIPTQEGSVLSAVMNIEKSSEVCDFDDKR